LNFNYGGSYWFIEYIQTVQCTKMIKSYGADTICEGHEIIVILSSRWL